MIFSHSTFLGYYFLVATSSCMVSIWGSNRYEVKVKEESTSTFVYSFLDTTHKSTDTDHGDAKALNFDDFVALGAKYTSDKDAYKILNHFLHDIRDRLKDAASNGFIFEAPTDQEPFVFTVKKQSWNQDFFQFITTGHFDSYFDTNKDATMLMITSPNKNILLVPRHAYTTLYSFVYSAPQKDRDDFWVLFFAFLDKYKDQISKIGVNIKKANEVTVPHLHMRFTPKNDFKGKLEWKKVIAKYEREEKYKVLTLCQENEKGMMELGTPVTIAYSKEEQEELDGIVVIPDHSSSGLMREGIVLLAGIVIGATWVRYQQGKDHSSKDESRRTKKSG